MSVQASANINTRPFVLVELPIALRLDDAIIFQDAGRATPLTSKTLMAKIAATGKWVPFTDETAVDGTAIPAGVYDPEGALGDIAAADIVAGDVVDVPILIFGARFDKDQLVIENSKTLATVIGAATVQAKTVEDVLREKSLIAEDTISASSPENA